MATFDERNSGLQYPVARYEVAQQSWASGVTAAATPTLANVNGLVEQITVKVSNATNAITFTVAIADADSGTLFSKASIAENGTTVIKATSDATDFDAFLAAGTLTFTVTPSGDPGASGVTVDIKLYVR